MNQFEWWRYMNGIYFATRNGEGGNVAQVSKAGSRKAGAGWHWWAYGYGAGDSSTMEAAQQAAEEAVLKGDRA